MDTIKKSNIIATGFAMFSMFFGAGNIVFPLAVGLTAQSQNIFAILGLLITAVGVPFMGLLSMSLFHGDYRTFFSRIGEIPGFLVALFIMALIGPLGAMPRCVALSYSTFNIYFGPLNIYLFSFFSCVLIYLLSLQRSKVLDLLGYVLTPFLLISLTIIIIKGIWSSPPSPISQASAYSTFFMGLREGYQTMDLLGAFFFSSVVIAGLQADLHASSINDYRKLLILTMKASAIGAFLLAAVYIGFSFVSALHSEELTASKGELLGEIALLVLGPYAGIIASVAVALACLTTAVALAAVFAEFLHRDIFQNKMSYHTALTLTVITTFFISILEFQAIVNVLAPVLQIFYPALIVLSLFNIFYKIYGVKTVKMPFYLVFGLALLAYIFENA